MVFPTNAPEGERLKFTSTILPPYLRRAKSIEELLPWLYLKGISTGDFSDALTALLGPDAPRLSASTVIPPFLTGCIRRTYAAIFSFWAGVIPPMPMFGRSLL